MTASSTEPSRPQPAWTDPRWQLVETWFSDDRMIRFIWFKLVENDGYQHHRVAMLINITEESS